MRRGIACWVLAICISALTYLNFLLVVLGSAPFWNALHQPGSVPHLVYRLSGRAYSFACFAAVPLQAAAVTLIVVSMLGTSFRRRCLAGVIAVAALAAAAGTVYTNVSELVQLPAIGPLVENRFVSVGSSLTYELVMLAAWLSLTIGLPHDRRTVRMLMWGGFAALAVQFASTVAQSYLAVFGTQPTYLDNGLLILNERPSWEVTLSKWALFYRSDLWFPTQMLLCLGLWACLRLVAQLAEPFCNRACGPWARSSGP